jgi:hypothetical protein
MSRTRTPSIVIAVAILAACGGGDGSASRDRGTTDSPSVDSVPDTTTTSPTPITADPVDTGGTTVASATSIVIDVTDAEPWRVELTDPVGPMLDGWVDQAVAEPTATDPPDSLDAQLTWIYEDLIELWRDDLRLVALGMNATALDRTHRETSPGAVIDLIGAAGSVLRDSYAIIAAKAELVVAADSAAGPLFSAWSEYSRRWIEATEMVQMSMAEARDLAADDQACLLAIVDGDADCDSPAAESAMMPMAGLDDRFRAIDEVDLDDLGSYPAFGLEFDECQAWDAAVEAAALTSDEQLRIWIGIDDNELDVYFAGLSECAWVDNGEEDPQGDEAADLAIFRAYLAAVADAIVDSGYDESVYEMGGGAEDERRYYEFTSAQATEQILTAGRDSASQSWSAVYNPELATKLYVVAGIEIDDWTQLDDRQLDWDDLGIGLCDGWGDLIEGYPVDRLDAIFAAVNDLGLAGSLIPEACD